MEYDQEPLIVYYPSSIFEQTDKVVRASPDIKKTVDLTELSASFVEYTPEPEARLLWEAATMMLCYSESM